MHPEDGELIFATSDLGLWASWTHHGPERGLPNVAVYDVQVNREVVVAYTHGREQLLNLLVVEAHLGVVGLELQGTGNGQARRLEIT